MKCNPYSIKHSLCCYPPARLFIRVLPLCCLCNELHNQAMGKACNWDSNIDIPVEKKAGNFSVPLKIVILHSLLNLGKATPMFTSNFLPGQVSTLIPFSLFWRQGYLLLGRGISRILHYERKGIAGYQICSGIDKGVSLSSFHVSVRMFSLLVPPSALCPSRPL